METRIIQLETVSSALPHSRRADAIEKRARFHVQGTRELDQIVDTQITVAALNTANVSGMQIDKVGEPFLR